MATQHARHLPFPPLAAPNPAPLRSLGLVHLCALGAETAAFQEGCTFGWAWGPGSRVRRARGTLSEYSCHCEPELGAEFPLPAAQWLPPFPCPPFVPPGTGWPSVTSVHRSDSLCFFPSYICPWTSLAPWERIQGTGDNKPSRDVSPPPWKQEESHLARDSHRRCAVFSHFLLRADLLLAPAAPLMPS